MEQGAIYRVSLDPASGHEQRGTRPVLVVSATAFNRLTGAPVVLPVTQGGGFARRSGFAVRLDHAGTATAGVVRCDQPRALDFTSRGAVFVEYVPPVLLEDVLARLLPIFEFPG
ncbi:MAG: type II toxin-antitoxin system PemK/MazF family toxin [Synergistales bacterium]|nr:type II toxin-antitoxin system PemK/MazF family toxin [Synergistales bacterium]